ncbi:LysE family translocator [Microvirga pudoricolor]|uniref:LysE family translocator n=1 Tax=Microvirga pudoricolor TaxID=2778729 RepID=UPI00194E181C|nr:LysE family transporter [Microvirga pudoricolor]MBM6595015.1 LysE family transporter [Microvirga pudoricolor]
MPIDPVATLLFTAAAVMLLGSPGPAIAALVAVGRRQGLVGGLRFYGGLQAGLAVAAGASALGLASVIAAFPVAVIAMTAVAAAYLVYLSYRIATAPVGPGASAAGSGFAATPLGGFLLGLSNPKSYVAFLALMGSSSIVPASAFSDAALKWTLCVLVMVVVDVAWLWLGVIVQKANLRPRTERALNMVMGGTILLTTGLAFL